MDANAWLAAPAASECVEFVRLPPRWFRHDADHDEVALDAADETADDSAEDADDDEKADQSERADDAGESERALPPSRGGRREEPPCRVGCG